MRAFLALLLFSTVALAAEAPKPVTIAVEPLGDRDAGVVANVVFRFANPRAITEAGLFLEASIRQQGRVSRDFHIAVPRKDTRGAFEDSAQVNGKVRRTYRWTLVPDQRNEISVLHTFAPGAAEVEARLVLEKDYGAPSSVVAAAAETFTVAKTNVAFAEPAAAPAEEPVPQPAGAVAIRRAGPTAAPNVYRIDVDVLPPVKRVEFWVGEKRIVSRNTPPYTAEVDLGDAPEPVLRVIGYAAPGRYVDADAFVLQTKESPMTVAVIRTATADGITHFKVSVRTAKGVRVKRVALYAGEKKLGEWELPPYAVDVPTASLAGGETVRAVAIDESGNEASELVRR